MITASRAQTWRTPHAVFTGLHNDYLFNIDAAADADNAKLLRFVDEQTDAFKYQFAPTDRCWCNPPFGMLREFLDLGRWWARRGTFWCFIVPANIETAWFHESAVWGDKHLFRSRVQFEPPPGVDASSPSFASMIVLYGPGISASGYGFSAARCGKTGVLL